MMHRASLVTRLGAYKGEWFLFYHDCVPSNDVTHLRSLKVQRLFYNEDGTIQRVINE